jgi:glycosyltransferase involved in cell wall biosynthesis
VATESFIATARQARVIKSSLRDGLKFEGTVFIGFYNAELYISQIHEQLKSQDLTGIKIVVADNASTDDTWNLLNHWMEDFRGTITLIRNPINTGAAGTLALNLDLFEGDWFLTFHQDDFYKPEHIKTLRQAFSTKKKIDCAFTEMGSLDSNRNVVPEPARAIWFLPNSKPETYFTANIRTHLMTWPSAGFNTRRFSEHLSPWHSAAFADTEIALKLSMDSVIQHIETVTMNYMENPESESHSMTSKESLVGAAIGLTRVFTSEDFKNFARSLPSDERGKFSERITKAVHVRLENSALAKFVELIALESLNEAWMYSDSSTLINLSQTFANIGGDRTAKLLEEIAKFMTKSETLKLKKELADGLSSDASAALWEVLLSKGAGTTTATRKKQPDSKRIARRLINAFPRRIRKRLLVTAKKFSIRINHQDPWNFR